MFQSNRSNQSGPFIATRPLRSNMSRSSMSQVNPQGYPSPTYQPFMSNNMGLNTFPQRMSNLKNGRMPFVRNNPNTFTGAQQTAMNYPYSSVTRTIGPTRTFMGTFDPTTLSNVTSINNVPISVPQSNGFTSGLKGILGGNKAGGGLASKLGGLSVSSVVGGIQKSISTVNQIMPMYHQLKPVLGNARTLLRMLKASNTLKDMEKTMENVENGQRNSNEQEDHSDLLSKHEVIDMTPTFLKETPLDTVSVGSKTSPSKPFFVE